MLGLESFVNLSQAVKIQNCNHKGCGWREGREERSKYYPHPIMISIITLTTLMDIKIVCEMVIRVYVCSWLGL